MKWKNYLHQNLSKKFHTSSLDEYSPFLASYQSYAGVEFPGRYFPNIDIEREPFPEDKLFISRFDINLKQDINFNKLIQIYGSNGLLFTY
jgi:hypothetical protein